jgi:D-allose transport system substrate-binding protein
MKIRTPIIAVALALSLAGLASRAQAADYAILLKTLSNPFWVSMKDGIEKEAQKLGVTVERSASSTPFVRGCFEQEL